MKKIFRAVAALAVVMFAGCTTDLNNEVVAPSVGGTTVTVGIADTRTYLGDLAEDGTRQVYWSESDQIAINGVTSNENPYLNEEKTKAVFEFATTLTYPYSVLYPAKAYVDAQTINLAAEQGRGLENVEDNVLPMAGYADAEGTVQLHHLAGAVKLQVKMAAEDPDMHSFRRVEVWGNNNEQMAGDFTIDYQNATLAPAGTNAESKIVLQVNKDNTAEGVITIFAVVPAVEYANGITIRIVDKAGHYMDCVSKAMTIEKGEIKAMPEVEFVPTGTIVDSEISIASAAEWNAFVKEYNADKYLGQIVSVKLTQDITFDDTTNAEFETAVASDGYFMGIVDGQNFSFKGLVATKPIFDSISGSEIKNLTIDASCAWTFSGYTFTATTYIGAIANDVFTSTFENITFAGSTTYENNTGNGGNHTVAVGNFFGRTNAHCTITNCTNSGSIVAQDSCDFALNDGAVPSATLHMGGLVGYSRCAMENCTNSGNITSNWNAKTKAIGGIVGRITGTGMLVGCSNSGTITYNSLRTPTNENAAVYDYNRTSYIGGVAGLPACHVTSCSNSGDVIVDSTIKSVFIGGVVSYTNTSSGNFTNLTNSGNISSIGAARYVVVGGVIGYSKTTGTLANFENSGTLLVSALDNIEHTTLDVGGIIGIATESCTLDGTSAYNIVNKGDVLYEYSTNIKYKYLSVGGIVGTLKAKATIKYVKNENPVQLLGNSSTNKSQTSYVGGIIGVAANAGTVLDNCINSNWIRSRERGNCYTDDSSTPLIAAQGYYGAGIVAYIYGEEGSLSAISNCHNTCDKEIVSDNEAGVVMNRGYGGGVVAYAKYTNISNCSSVATMEGQNTYIRLGGIASYLDNSHITDCSVNSAGLKSVNNTYVGGIASGVNAGSSIKNSTFNGHLLVGTNNLESACIAAFTKAGAVIEKCGVAGSVFGTTVTADNYAGYLVGDANTTPSDCYFLAE